MYKKIFQSYQQDNQGELENNAICYSRTIRHLKNQLKESQKEYRSAVLEKSIFVHKKLPFSSETLAAKARVKKLDEKITLLEACLVQNEEEKSKLLEKLKLMGIDGNFDVIPLTIKLKF